MRQYNIPMNKKVAVIALVVGAVIVLGLVGVLLFAKKSPQGSMEEVVEKTGSTNQTSAMSTLKDLIAKGVAQTCTFSNANSSGTVNVSGGKVRSDFQSTTEGQTINAHMIVDGNTSYLWMDNQTTGYKSTFNTQKETTVNSDENKPSENSPAGSFNADEYMNYNCKAGVVDASLFNLPQGINFMDLGAVPTGAVIPSGNESPTGVSNNNSAAGQCSVCNNLTGDSKTQCLQALHCE